MSVGEIEVRRVERDFLPGPTAGFLALVGRKLALAGQGVFLQPGILRDGHRAENQPLANHAIRHGRPRLATFGSPAQEPEALHGPCSPATTS